MINFGRLYLVSSLISGIVALATPAAPLRGNDAEVGDASQISEDELKAFAKAYVEFQQIRLAYEKSVSEPRDKQEESKAQHEAIIKIDSVFRKHGLEQATFARILATVNSDEEFRTKTMKLIEQERRSAQ
jgi:hypothetical protein